MKLIDLLEKLEYRCERGSVDTEITGVCYDSRKVTPGCLFVCMAGANFDGHDFAAGAAEQGAAAVEHPIFLPALRKNNGIHSRSLLFPPVKTQKDRRGARHPARHDKPAGNARPWRSWF